MFEIFRDLRPEPSFRDRFPRPSFMTVTVALALLVTPGVGLLAAELRDPAADSARFAHEADLALRGDLLAQGFAPLSARGESAVSALAALGVEVMVPERLFELESGPAALSGKPADARATELALAPLAVELARYPARFLARARLHRLVLCAKLHEGSEAIPSLPNYHGTLLVDVDADAHYLRRLVHHEVFHFADYADDDQLSRDPAWLALNDRYFVYGDGGRFRREPGAGRFTSEQPGFVSRYATSALEEDKAETFAMRMCAPAQFAALLHDDEILRAKSTAVEAQLRKLSPALDDDFFRRIDGR
ncbi:MAG TPA: hypothetical protein VF294_15070 [Polyangiaceae bacterium]